MRFWTLGTIALLAACLLGSDRAYGQRAGRKRTSISTRPIPSETTDDPTPSPTEPPKLRQTSAESPVRAKTPPATTSRQAPSGLPNEHGQIWREYDLRPYIGRVKDVPHPEQAIVDWILRETGYETWHSEPFGVLSASSTTLRVYHTPEMQRTVGALVDRFVAADQAERSVAVRVVSLGSPTWRSRAPAKLTPVEVQAPGMQAWLLAKEDAAILLADLAKRSDFQDVGSPQNTVPNGVPTVISAQRTRNYTQHLLPGVTGVSAFAPQTATMDEGFALEVTPLAALDGATTDVLLRCNIDQVERIFPVTLETGPALLAPSRTKIEVPQRSQLRVKESFRWSNAEVLLVSLGMGPAAIPSDANLLEKALPLPLPESPARAETLIFLESRAPARAATAGGTAPKRR